MTEALSEPGVEQIKRVVDGVRAVLGPELVGAYLHGSAALGGLGPHSDIDILAVSKRGTTREEKRQLVDHLLAVSRRPRPVELTIVVETEIRPWRYPPAFDFQYGDWWRDSFERGQLEPWPSATSPDLASLVTMVLLGDRPLVGPPPAQVFDPVPRSDYVDALVYGIGGLLHDLDADTRNIVLTLARIWSAIEAGATHSKAEAAEWALPRLSEEHRQVLARARAIHLGEEHDGWDDIRPQVRAYADRVVAEIERVIPNA
jgi:predicted nucleotidyltransferase